MSHPRPGPGEVDRQVRQALSRAAAGSRDSRNLLRGIEQRCRRFLEEERWARITLRWTVVAGLVLAVLLTVEQLRQAAPSPGPGAVEAGVDEYFQDTTLEEGEVLTALVVGEVPE